MRRFSIPRVFVKRRDRDDGPGGEASREWETARGHARPGGVPQPVYPGGGGRAVLRGHAGAVTRALRG